jgi:hypothetical protein
MIASGLFASGVPAGGFLAAYGFGYLAAALLAGEILRGILEGATKIDAARAALTRDVLPTVLSALAGAILACGWLFRAAPAAGLGVACVLVGAIPSVLVFVPFAASVLPYGETFFVRANRLRERRESLVRVLALVAQPRWGISLSGIALVFATLGWFGAAPFLRHHGWLAEPALWAASALAMFAVAFAVGRDWRAALAAMLALAVLTLTSMWLWGRAVGHVRATAFIAIAVTLAAASLTMGHLIAARWRFRISGDEPQTALLRAIETLGVAPLFGSLGAAGAIAPWIAQHGSVAGQAVMFLLAAVAASLAMPGLAGALETLVRRRRSVDELYGRG